MKTLVFDSAGCFGERLGSPAAIPEAMLSALEATQSLEETRRKLMVQAAASAATASAATASAAGSYHFATAPQRLLHDYNTTRPTSVLYQLLRTANRLRDHVDRVVVLAPPATRLAIQALMQACCDPFFNELSRGERGSRPRLYLDGDHWDNDVAQGLLRLLGVSPTSTASTRPDVLERRWAVVVIDPAGYEPGSHSPPDPGRVRSPLGAAWQRYEAALRSECREDWAAMAQRVTFVVASQSPWNAYQSSWPGVELFPLAEQRAEQNTEQNAEQDAAQQASCGDEFDSLFSVATLLPAAILGIDVVKLLHAAAAMQRCFEQTPVGANPVLDYVATWEQLGRDGRVGAQRWLSSSPSLRGLTEWAERLLGSAAGYGGDPLAATHITLEQYRCDPLPVTLSGTVQTHGQRPDEPFAMGHLPQRAQEADRLELQRAREAGWARATLQMARADEEGLGQFFQMLLLIRECQRLRLTPWDFPRHGAGI